MIRHIATIVTLSAAFFHVCAADSLFAEINKFVSGFDATVGVAVITATDTIEINCDRTYPLASVMKFPQALAACEVMQENGISVDSVVTMTKSDLHENTYSPICQIFPGGVSLTIDSLFSFSIAQSDNNACDKIFSMLISPSETESYLHGLGYRSFAIAVTEDDMHRNPYTIRANSASPVDVAALFKKFADGQLISGEYYKSVRNALKNCQTGIDQLHKPLAADDIILHKTGTGFRGKDGRITAQNDAGWICLSDGTEYAIAVMITDSAEDDATNSAIIAGVSGIVRDYFTYRPQK